MFYRGRACELKLIFQQLTISIMLVYDNRIVLHYTFISKIKKVNSSIHINWIIKGVSRRSHFLPFLFAEEELWH